MPTLNKPKRTHSTAYKKYGQQADIQKIYNTSIWKKLRQGYISQHPLCESCLLENKITPAYDVHHIREISNGRTILEMQDIAYDSNNLMSLCRECHRKIHSERHKEKKILRQNEAK